MADATPVWDISRASIQRVILTALVHEGTKTKTKSPKSFCKGPTKQAGLSQMTGVCRSSGDASRDFITYQKHRAKLQADPAATWGHGARNQPVNTAHFINGFLILLHDGGQVLEALWY